MKLHVIEKTLSLNDLLERGQLSLTGCASN